MQLHELHRPRSRKTKKRVGRGGKRGTYSGRGMKGQKQRAGAKFPPSIRELIKRYPKLRGSRANIQRTPKAQVNLDVLEKRLEEGAHVTPELLLEKHIIRRIEGKVPVVKILGRGEMQKRMTFQGFEMSKAAAEKIKKAGGNSIGSA